MRTSKKNLFCIIFTLCILTVSAALAGNALAADGITPSSIFIGQSCDLSDDNKRYGKAYRDGSLAYFKYLNSKGGINGRNVRLITYDDKGNSEVSIDNTKKLLATDKVFLLFGYTIENPGTNLISIVNQNKIPLFAPSYGGNIYREPFNRNIFNIKASFRDEVKSIVRHLKSDKNIKRVSIFYKNNEIGRSSLKDVVNAMGQMDVAPLNTAGYSDENEDLRKVIEVFNYVKPDAMILLGSLKQNANIIRKLRSAGSDALFINLSSINAEMLGEDLGNNGIGVVISQVVPFPYYRKVPVVAEYNNVIEKHLPGTEPSYPGLEGYIAAKALCEVLRDIEGEPTREKFITTAESLYDIDLGGVSATFEPGNHMGSDRTFFSQIGPGGFISPLKGLNRLYKQ